MSVESPADRLVKSAAKGNSHWLGYWLDVKKVPVDILSTKDRRTALGAAARGGHYEIVKLLLSRHAQVNVGDNQGLTPLAWAVMQLNKTRPGAVDDYVRIVDLLLRNGADFLSP